jgi:membrane protease YdiL (CAAX protease family)
MNDSLGDCPAVKSNEPGRSSWLCFSLAVTAFAAIFWAVAARYERRFHLSPAALAGIYFCFILQLAEAIAPAFHACRVAIRRLPIWCFPFVWLLPYLLYAAGTGDWRWAAIKLLAVSVPVLILYKILPPREVARFSWQDAAVGLWLTAIVLSQQLRGVWTVPANLDFLQRLYLISMASWIWIFVRPVPKLGYEVRVASRVFRAAALNFVLFSVLAMPIGFVLHFNAWNPRWRGLGDFCLNYLEIFLFIAVLEETFFRGFLQTLLSASFGVWWKGQLLVSCLFGLFHILHVPFPNWRYVLLATIAGWFYGTVFRQGQTLFASSLVHAMVDTVWRTWFTAH